MILLKMTLLIGEECNFKHCQGEFYKEQLYSECLYYYKNGSFNSPGVAVNGGTHFVFVTAAPRPAEDRRHGMTITKGLGILMAIIYLSNVCTGMQWSLCWKSVSLICHSSPNSKVPGEPLACDSLRATSVE